MGRKVDISGMVFDRLTVIGETSKRSSSGGIVWACLCECGETTYATAYALKSQHKRSCGCLHKDVLADIVSKKNTTHGMAGNDTYVSWLNMRGRCSNKKNKKYALYGGRGISVCKSWDDSFLAFVDNMGEKPSRSHQIDRIDTNGNYCPENCRWATGVKNQQNRRNSKWWFIDGVKYESAGHAARELGLNTGTIFWMCNGGKDGCYSVAKYHD